MTDTSAVRKLREVRNDAGLTLRELAERSDVALSTVWQIESGRQPRPQLATAMKVAAALGVDPHDIKEFRPGLAEVEKQGIQHAEREKQEGRASPRPPARSARLLPVGIEGVVEQEIANMAGGEFFTVDLRPEIVQAGAEQALDRLMEHLGRDTVDRIYERRFGKDSETQSDQEE
jgi:transcriptional regulator with XRE-family HTH domain